jgi:hypothetical protein
MLCSKCEGRPEVSLAPAPSATASIGEEKPKRPVVKKIVMRTPRRKTEGDPDASAEAMKAKIVMRPSRRRET